jgi:hypothetical protein
MGEKLVYYTAIFCYSIHESARLLEKEYLHFLKQRKVMFESRHMRIDLCQSQGFEVSAKFFEWIEDGKPMCYCRRELK